MKKILMAFTLSWSSLGLAAGTDIFTDAQFSTADFESISEDLGALFSHTTNSGADSLGNLFGVEVGLVLGAANTKNFDRLAEKYSGEDQKVDYLPTAGLIAGVALPVGIGAELSLIPKVDFEDGSLQNTSLALRWSLTDVIPLVGSFSPVKISTRLAYGKSSLDYNFSIGSNDQEEVSLDITNLELGAFVGVNLIVAEPYLGLSTIKTKSDLDAVVKLSSGQYSTTQKRTESVDISGTKLTAGILFKLTLLRLGLEYSTVNSIPRYTAKLSFKF